MKFSKKIIFIFILLAVSITILPAYAEQNNQQANNDDEWYPYVIPAKLDPNSPANIGKLVLDAPAGKHGFCKAKDGHFYFEDGTRAKFWGTNLCFNACFPEKKWAEILADRMAFFGFNAVRLHHMDWGFEPQGIFEDVCPAFKDPQMKKTGMLSKRQLDRLDYLIYQLKIRGIYIDMNLLVSRHFTKADGVVDADKLGMAAKPSSMFDTRLIELEKQYAKDLLTHYNPHTKLRYCDDPAIALIEITNENSIVRAWENNELNGNFYGLKQCSIPPSYVQDLNNKWNAWLKIKYGTMDTVKKAWSDDSSAASAAELLKAQDWSLEQHQGASATLLSQKELIQVKVEKITNTPWHLQLRQSGVSLEKDKNYLFKFTAKIDPAMAIETVCQLANAPFTNLGLSESLKPTNQFSSFEVPFTTKETTDNAKIAFIIGYAQGTIEIKDISLIEAKQISITRNEEQNFNFARPLHKLRAIYPKQRIKDIEEFYDNLEKIYYQEMVTYLKQDLSVRIPITGSQYSKATTQTSCDYIDRHAYWDHPVFPNKQWDMNDFRITNKSALNDKELGIIGEITKRQKTADPNKPFTITEWNHCYPNQYAYETPVLLAEKALENNWDALFQFDFSGGWKKDPIFNTIASFFDILANPQQLILCSVGSYAYLSEKPIKKPGDSSGCYLIAIDNKPLGESKNIILVAVGEITNAGSNKINEKSSWGYTPSLLKRITIPIELKIKKDLKIYKLAADGSKREQLSISEAGFKTWDSDTPWYVLTSN